MNWWLVARRLKHGMVTVRRAGLAPGGMAGMQHQSQGAHQLDAMPEHSGQSVPAVPGITIGIVIGLSFLIMAAGIAIGISCS